MAGIQITGLASGLNWQNIINELIAADKAPETQWESEQSTNQTEVSSLSTLQTDLQSLQSAADALSTGTTFSASSATLSETSLGWSASAAPNTDSGTYSFDVTKLASNSVLSGAADVGAKLSTSSDVSGVTVGTMNVATPVTPGTFTIDGAKVTVTSSESLQDVFSAISTATSGAVTASYDPTGDKVQLLSSSNITLGAANDTSNFLSSMGLYNNDSDSITSESALGSVSTSATLADAGFKSSISDVDSNGNGSFSINGVNFNFNVNTSTVQSILNNINSSSAGVTATFNGANSQFTLTNNSTGDTGIAVNESSGGLLAAMGLTTAGGSTFSEGSNAQYTINNSGPFTSSSNTLDASLDGITGLSVTATSLGTQNVTVAPDTSGISTAVNSLISAYNTVQTYITAQTQITNSNGTVTTNPLSGDQDAVQMQSDLQNILFNSVSSATGSISALDQIGIGFSGTSPLLSIQDQTTLNNAIANNPSGIAQIFNGSDGIVSQLDTYINNATSSTGSIAAETNALNSENDNLETQITNLNTQLTSTQQQLTTEFTNMETAEEQYQEESSTLTAILNGGTASSSSSSSSSSPSTTQSSANANASTSSATSSTA
jgi:flagellar hook-associated protein 2